MIAELQKKTPWKGNADALASRLRQKIEGEVRFDDGSRAIYAADASNYRFPPIGVVIPKTIEDVVETVAVARSFDAPILSRGGGTSLAGQCCNHAVVMDMSKHLHKIVDLHPGLRYARVQPGIVLDSLRAETRKHGLTFGPDPATHDHCTLGGMLGNDSCGSHSVMAQFYGPGSRVADNVEELEILTYDGLRLKVGKTSPRELERIIHEGGPRGQIYGRLKALRDKYASLIERRYPKIPRRVSGYNLDDLLPDKGFNVAAALVGSEATCVTILEAKLTLIKEPPKRSLLMLGYPSVFEAADHVMEILPFKPTALEGFDDLLIDFNRAKGTNTKYLHLLPEGKGWLLVEVGGDTQEEADARAAAIMARLAACAHPPKMKLYDHAEAEKDLWEIRESGLGATAFIPNRPDQWPGWEDSAVRPEKMGAYLRKLRVLMDKYNYRTSFYGHFGQGCVHCRLPFDLYTNQGIKKYRAFLDEAADLVISMGGSLSGEHGDGQCRAELLPKMFGPELVEAFREFKAIWDPRNKMNPGKIVEPNPIISDLRLGADYRPWEPDTYFKYPSEDGSFARAALRCVGVGKCRRHEGGTMCPSYRVTLEEEHSTRGRAHMLFEMLNGGVVKNGWRDQHVFDSLDLCLSCKGCKADCPVNVDMATYKAEFLSHYYKGRLRPRAAYAMGLIYWWARIASHFPRVVNYFSKTEPFATVVKWIGGIAPERKMPRFARQTFRAWFKERGGSRIKQGRPVILWPDTFNNHFFPPVLQSMVEVLEAAGFRVVIPEKQLCCGRPLYDYGMLPTAIKLLRQTLDALKTDIAADTPIVGCEPSCIAVFRDELKNLFPNDHDARRLSNNVLTLGEFLKKHAPHFQIPQLDADAILHGHCHHKAVMGLESEEDVLRQAVVKMNVLDSGCCGMAGSFGFEKEKYDVSVKCGELVLLPKVREAGQRTLIVADGFSCREQIEQLTNQKPLHTAQVVELALRHGAVRKPSPKPAKPSRESLTRPPRRRTLVLAGAVAAGIAIAAGAGLLLCRRPSKHSGVT